MGDVFLAIAEESRAQGIPFAGHVPFSVSAREASDLGQRSMEHQYGALASCSSEEDSILKDRVEGVTEVVNAGEEQFEGTPLAL